MSCTASDRIGGWRKRRDSTVAAMRRCGSYQVFFVVRLIFSPNRRRGGRTRDKTIEQKTRLNNRKRDGEKECRYPSRAILNGKWWSVLIESIACALLMTPLVATLCRYFGYHPFYIFHYLASHSRTQLLVVALFYFVRKSAVHRKERLNKLYNKYGMVVGRPTTR